MSSEDKKNEEQSEVIECEDKKINGICTKGADCKICNKKKDPPRDQNKLNLDAKGYVPSKKKKLNLNVNAKEYYPKNQPKDFPKDGIDLNADENDDDEDDEKHFEEMDMIMKDVVENDLMDEMGDMMEDSDDEDKWYPKYKDCECCKGFVYKCNGKTCEALGQCFCKMKDDCDDFDKKIK